MGDEWRERTRGVALYATHREREARIHEIARRQKWLITRSQLLAAGLSRATVSSRASRGLLVRVHSGVYATVPPPLSLPQLWLAATLACGAGALLSHWSAAQLWEILGHPSQRIHVVTAVSAGRGRPGIQVHRSPVDPRDVRVKDGIPCTSVDRVLVDLAPHHTEAELETLLVAGESEGLVRRHRLVELVAERRGGRGIPKLASLLGLEPAIVRSELELAFLPIWREAHVERPLVNHPIAVPGREQPLIVDFAWPAIRMVVEADSQRFHGDWEQAETDRERDQLLALVGWASHRFVRRRIKNDPSGSADRLRALTDARIRELGQRV